MQNNSPTQQSTGRCAIKPRSAGDFYVRDSMRPLFTIHAGEFVVGEHIEQQFPKFVWIPSKDT